MFTSEKAADFSQGELLLALSILQNLQRQLRRPVASPKLLAEVATVDVDHVDGGENTQSSWIVGAYHPLTKSVNLVAEYTYSMYEEKGGTAPVAETNAKTVSLGAIMFF